MIVERVGDHALCATPGDADDVWALHEALRPGDVLRAATLRKVHTEDAAGDVRDTQRVATELSVRMDRVAGADLAAGVLRVSGKVAEQSALVRTGQHHTLELVPGRPVRIVREAGVCALEAALRAAALRVRPGTVGVLALDPAQGHAEAAVCALRFDSLSSSFALALLRPAGHSRASAKALRGSSAAERASCRLADGACALVAEGMPLAALSAVVVACPDADALAQVVQRIVDAPAAEKTLRARIVALALPAPSIDALLGALSPQHVLRVCSVAQAAERAALDDFHRLADAGRATFGLGHVRSAAEMGAVALLLLADDLFRATDIARRREVAAIVSLCEDAGGRVVVFAKHTPPSDRLAALTGIAAVLHFPVDFDAL